MWSPLSEFCTSNLKSIQKPPKAPQFAFLIKIAETLNESKDCNFKLACGSQTSRRDAWKFHNKTCALVEI